MAAPALTVAVAVALWPAAWDAAAPEASDPPQSLGTLASAAKAVKLQTRVDFKNEWFDVKSDETPDEL